MEIFFGEISFSHKIWGFMSFWLVDTVIILQNNEIWWDFGLIEIQELVFWLKILLKRLLSLPSCEI